VSANIDLVGTVFSGDPMVFWGFTGATGGSRNEQRVCTSLNPDFAIPEGQGTCYTDAVQFKDSSTSFGTILNWYWDFGDGSVDSVQTPAPHKFPAPGEYTVQLKILGNNGCVSEPFSQKIVIGSKPVAAFKSFDGPICENSSIALADSSYVEFGTINTWAWTIGNQTSSNRFPSLVKIDQPGDIPVSLKVKTREGCESDVHSATLVALAAPEIDFTFTEACVGSPSVFTAINLNPGITVQKWNWSLGDNNTSNQKSFQHLYAAGGKYAVQLSALGNNGCLSDLLVKEVNAYETNAFAGNDTIIADTQPLQLQASGGIFYSWSPATGLSDPSIPDPVATLTKDMIYVLTVSSPEGCSTNDTINIKVFKGPALYVPTAFTPNGDGRNDQLKFIAAGVTVDLFQVYNRYGQLVYSSHDAQKGWDGTLNGKEQSTGTYVWMIKGKDFTGTVHSKKGTVTLIR
jgi:gliding motility-associated-like protein